jgi:hypothetical protein
MPRRKRRRKKKNIKVNNAGYFFPRPLAVILVLATVLGINFLWLHARCAALGKDIKKLERKKKNLLELRQHEEFKWCKMKTPKNVVRMLRKHNIKMEWPSEDRIVWLSNADWERKKQNRAVLAQRVQNHYR